MAKAWLALIALLSLGFCATTPLQQFINSTFEPDQNVSLSSIAGGKYFLISAQGVDTYVFDTSTGRKITDKQLLVDALSEDVKAKTSFDSRVQSASLLPSIVKSAKQKDEAQCMLLTGTDMHQCTDKQSCILSCKSNPNCDIILYADGFWEALLDWSSKRTAFDSKIAAYSQNIESIPSDTSTIDSKMALLTEMEYLAANMSKNTIFLNRTDIECQPAEARCFEYCKKIDYSQARLSAERQSLLVLKGAVQSIKAASARAEAVLATGKANDEYVSKRQAMLRSLLVSSQNSINHLNSSIKDAAKKVDDLSFASSLSGLSLLYSQMSSLGDEGYYRQALGLKDDFEARQKDLEGKLSSSLKAHSALEAKLDDFEAKLGKSKGIIGEASAGYYSQTWQEEKSKLSSPLTLQQISAIGENIDKLDDKLTEEIADKATSGAGQAPLPSLPPEAQSAIPRGLPCAPAFIAVLLLAFGFAYSHRKN